MKKKLILLYGIISYIVFLGAFLYAIGFVGNFVVPKSIDSGAEGPLTSSLLVDLLLMGLFAIQHSVMARPKFKRWWKAKINPAAERSTYVLFSSLALILLYMFWQPLKTVIWEVQNPLFASVLTALFFLGWLVVLLSTFMIDHFELFGLRQVYNHLKGTKTGPPKFQQKFLYKYVRHPIMMGFIIAFWATPVMTLGHLVFAATTSLYIIVAVKYFEEKDLAAMLGKDYETYQKRVPMFFPFLKKRA